MQIPPLQIILGREDAWGLFMVEKVRHPAQQAERAWHNHTHYALNIVLHGEGELIDPAGQSIPLLPGVAYQHLPGDAAEGWRVKWLSADAEEIFCLLDQRSHARMDALKFFPSERHFPQQDPRELVHFLRHQIEAFHASAASLPLNVNRQAIAQCTVLLGAVLDRLESTTQPTEDDATLAKICRRLAADPADRKPLPDLARELGTSYPMLRKNFRKAFGITLREYRIQLRIEAARGLLTRFNVKETAEKLGYPDAFTFSAQYKQVTGQSPVESRRA